MPLPRASRAERRSRPGGKAGLVLSVQALAGRRIAQLGLSRGWRRWEVPSYRARPLHDCVVLRKTEGRVGEAQTEELLRMLGLTIILLFVVWHGTGEVWGPVLVNEPRTSAQAQNDERLRLIRLAKRASSRLANPRRVTSYKL